MQSKASVYVIALILLASAVSAVVILPERAAGAYSTHAAIYINGDSGFVSANGVIDGSGTASDPYIIAGWEIDASIASGIKVEHANAYFIIKDIYVHSGSSGHNLGIDLFMCDHATIENCTAVDCGMGIFAANSGNITISNCYAAYNVDAGIFVEMCNFNTKITNNEACHNLNGIYNNDAWDTLISGNKVHNNSQYGIVMTVGSFSVRATDNDVVDNGAGITVNLWSYWIPTDQIFIFHNKILRNTIQASDNNLGHTHWDDGYPNGGNSWSDYFGSDLYGGPGQNVLGPDGIGDMPYSIDATSKDRYPLMINFSIPDNQLVASFDITPSAGDTRTIFTFDASSSSDADEPTATLLAHWDWENDGVWDTAWTTNKIAYHQYSSTGDYTALLEVKDSSGHLAGTIRSVSVSVPPLPPPIKATIRFDPSTLYINSSGQSVAVFIELDKTYDVRCINVSTVLLLGKVPASSYPSTVGDKDKDKIPDLMVKFDRNATIAALNTTSLGKTTGTITVSGSLLNGTSFSGSDVIKVIKLDGDKSRANKSLIGLGVQNIVILGIGTMGMSVIIAAALTSLIAMRKKVE